MRGRPTNPSQLYRPRPRQKEKDPLGEELGDPRENYIPDSIIPDTWYADKQSDFERLLSGRYTDSPTTDENLSLTEGIQTSVERVIDWEERFWNELVPKGTYDTPPPPPGEPPGPPEVHIQEDVYEDDAFEALRANDNIDVVIERADKDTSHQGFDYLKRAIDIYVKANTWRYEPRLWFRNPTRRNICDYVERRDHKGSGNRKGKKRGLAEQQQIKLWYLCRG